MKWFRRNKKEHDGAKPAWAFPFTLSDVAFGAGAGVTLTGIWWVYPPATLVLGGASLCVVALKIGVSHEPGR